MSRHGYSEGECYDVDDMLRMEGYRQAVRMAVNGKRGQKFLRELADTLDAMPVKKLCIHDLQRADGMACALGAAGKARGVDMTEMDPENHEGLSKLFDIAPSMVREIEYMNDDDLYGLGSDPWRPGIIYKEIETPVAWKPNGEVLRTRKLKTQVGIRKNAAGQEVDDNGRTKTQWEDWQDELRWSRVREWVRNHVHE